VTVRLVAWWLNQLRYRLTLKYEKKRFYNVYYFLKCVGIVCTVCKSFLLTSVRPIIGAQGSIMVKALCYKPEVAGSIPDEVNF
jgi:hypothetical protein